MPNTLFLLDGMALVYRAHFALLSRPIFTSTGVNTSALYGFTQTLLEILRNHQPTHLAVAFDTEAPTQRHREFAEYKIQREAMPEDLALAIPHVRRMIQAFRIPVLTCDGYEADDIIGTVARRAEREDFTTYMVSPDKDFGQLVTERTLLFRPSRMGDAAEVLGPAEVCRKWGIQNTAQVIDMLALWGDTSDNIPGVPGIGEKTASKLIAQYGSLENLLAHAHELKGKLKENLEQFRDQAILSKRLATIDCNAPCPIAFDDLVVRAPDNDALRALCIEFEFNSIGRRLFGDDFKAGRGFTPAVESPATEAPPIADSAAESDRPTPAPPLTAYTDLPFEHHLVTTAEQRKELIKTAKKAGRVGLAFFTGSSDAGPRLRAIAISTAPSQVAFIPVPAASRELLNELAVLFENPRIEKIGHDFKTGLSLLNRCGASVQGPMFDTMLAHSIVEPDLRHSLPFLCESLLGIELPGTAGSSAPSATETPSAPAKAPALDLIEVNAPETDFHTCVEADLVLRLRDPLHQSVREKQQERVFFEIEMPLAPVLVDMECEGIRVDAAALDELGKQLASELATLERSICQLAGREFNVNSPRQLGEILFDVLKICEKPKKTRTGQYATNEQTLLALAPEHEIVRRLLDYRIVSKLKSTYIDALPAAINPETGRIHTTYYQLATATGRLNSQNPNLQNIPIRTDKGREIRRAFVPRNAEYKLLSADYSQIELRIIASLSRERAMIEAFQAGLDIHTATAGRVYGVALDGVTAEMRRKAKMVNYGIAYGISAFGLAQRLAIPRKEAATIIDQYFAQFPGVLRYMEDTIESCRKHGYVETVTGRRRYLRDIRSSNATVRGAAERNAINAPIQGTAADMIKIAMTRIHRELIDRKLRTRMLLQVHDELVFDLFIPEKEEVLALVRRQMAEAIPLDVPIVVETGIGDNWLEAH